MNKKEPLPTDNTGTGKLGSIRVLTKAEKKLEEKCDECKMSMADHTTCECCQEPMCEDEDKIDMPEGWYHPDCHSDVYG